MIRVSPSALARPRSIVGSDPALENRSDMGPQLSLPSRRRRQTASPAMNAPPPPSTRYRGVTPGHHQCTHLIMIRLYTTEFKCSICLEHGQFGWLYRCAQDRELLLDNDFERGFMDNITRLDSIGGLFERPSTRPRSPGARSSPLAFLEEVTDEQLKTYSPSQVAQILSQRAHLLEILKKQSNQEETSTASKSPSDSTNQQSTPSVLTSEESNVAANKPWLNNGECQFKVCGRCRPSFRERSYLSMDAIANGDYPATAVAGFGFDVIGQRPVVSADLMKSIGLRSPPAPRPPPIPKPVQKTPIALGLGIRDSVGKPTANWFMRDTLLGAALASSGDGSSPITQPPIPTVVLLQPDNDPDKTTTQSSIARFPDPSSPATLPFRSTTPLLTHRNSSTLLLALDTPLPHETDEEEEARRPLTPMEKDESKEGRFGSLPLEVSDGVAVLEESVELHSADVITQY